MCPRYEADPTKDVAGFPVLPKGDYRLKLGEPKPFVGETKQGDNKGKTNYGVAFLCTVVPGPVDTEGNVSPADSIGKKAFQRLFYHTEDAAGFRKQFQLAAFGYSQKEEEEFNQKLLAEGTKFGFNTDTGEVDDGWKAMANREIVASLSVTKQKKNQNDPNSEEVDQQKWDSVRPIPTISA